MSKPINKFRDYSKALDVDAGPEDPEAASDLRAHLDELNDQWDDIGMIVNVPGYEDLRRILDLAYEQASVGKGNVRHAAGRTFDNQPLLLIQELVGAGFALGQAIKKCQESQRMTGDKAKQELLGAIIYIAGAYLFREREEKRNAVQD